MDQDTSKPIPATSSYDICNWIIANEWNITYEIIKNAWRKTGYYSYYFGEFGEAGIFAGNDVIIGKGNHYFRDYLDKPMLRDIIDNHNSNNNKVGNEMGEV